MVASAMGVSPDDHDLCFKAESLERPWSLTARRRQLAPLNRIAFLAARARGPRPGRRPTVPTAFRLRAIPCNPNRTGRFPASGSRTRLHAFAHGTSCPSAVKRIKAAIMTATSVADQAFNRFAVLIACAVYLVGYAGYCFGESLGSLRYLVYAVPLILVASL